VAASIEPVKFAAMDDVLADILSDSDGDNDSDGQQETPRPLRRVNSDGSGRASAAQRSAQQQQQQKHEQQQPPPQQPQRQRQLASGGAAPRDIRVEGQSQRVTGDNGDQLPASRGRSVVAAQVWLVLRAACIRRAHASWDHFKSDDMVVQIEEVTVDSVKGGAAEVCAAAAPLVCVAAPSLLSLMSGCAGVGSHSSRARSRHHCS
jgi:hypothetical protein